MQTQRASLAPYLLQMGVAIAIGVHARPGLWGVWVAVAGIGFAFLDIVVRSEHYDRYRANAGRDPGCFGGVFYLVLQGLFNCVLMFFVALIAVIVRYNVFPFLR